MVKYLLKSLFTLGMKPEFRRIEMPSILFYILIIKKEYLIHITRTEIRDKKLESLLKQTPLEKLISFLKFW